MRLTPDTRAFCGARPVRQGCPGHRHYILHSLLPLPSFAAVTPDHVPMESGCVTFPYNHSFRTPGGLCPPAEAWGQGFHLFHRIWQGSSCSGPQEVQPLCSAEEETEAQQGTGTWLVRQQPWRHPVIKEGADGGSSFLTRQ